MSLVSLGDLAQSFVMRRNMGQVKAELQILTQEMTTGVSADTVRHTGADLGPLNAISASLARLAAYHSATTELELFSGAMQTALQTVDGFATDLAPQLLSAGAALQDSTLDALGAQAEQSFKAAVAAFNTRVGDRSLFAGSATHQTPLPEGEALLATLETVVAGAATAADVAAALDGWFTDPAGYAAQAYQGSAAMAEITIAPGEKAAIGVTALDVGIRDTLKGLAMAALMGRGVPGEATVGRAALATMAGGALLAAQPHRAGLAAATGMVEGQIAAAQARNSAEITALELARAKIVSVDPFEAATKVKEAQTQLEMIYAVTARLSSLSLMEYLR